MRFCEFPTYKAIIFRPTYPELLKEVIPRALKWFPAFYPGVKYNGSEHVFRFPSGACIFLGHCDNDATALRVVMGAEFHFYGFDELTLFKAWWFDEITAGLRSSDNIPLRMRGTTNPGGRYPAWVFERFAPWLDPRSAFHAAPDQVLYVDPPDEHGREVFHLTPAPERQSRQFIPAQVGDNPYLNTNYRRQLMNLRGARRQELLEGDWLVGLVREKRCIQKYDHTRIVDDVLEGNSVRYSVGIDHGELAGHQTARLLADDVTRKRVQIEGEWSSDVSTGTQQDAEGIRRMLNRHPRRLQPHDVGLWVGDVNSGGKGAPGMTCNAMLGKELGVDIQTPKKGDGSVDAGIKRLNDAFGEDYLWVLRSCEETRSDLSLWEGGDDEHKHGMDGLRYIAMPVFDRCNIVTLYSGDASIGVPNTKERYHVPRR